MARRAQRPDVHIVKDLLFLVRVALHAQQNIAVHELIIFQIELARTAQSPRLGGILAKPRIGQPRFFKRANIEARRLRHRHARQALINGFFAHQKPLADNQRGLGIQIIAHPQTRRICVIGGGQFGQCIAATHNMRQRAIVAWRHIKPLWLAQLAFAQDAVHGQNIIRFHP